MTYCIEWDVKLYYTIHTIQYFHGAADEIPRRLHEGLLRRLVCAMPRCRCVHSLAFFSSDECQQCVSNTRPVHTAGSLLTFQSKLSSVCTHLDCSQSSRRECWKCGTGKCWSKSHTFIVHTYLFNALLHVPSHWQRKKNICILCSVAWFTFTLACHTARSCIFHACDLLPHFPRSHIAPLHFGAAYSNPAFFSRPVEESTGSARVSLFITHSHPFPSRFLPTATLLQRSTISSPTLSPQKVFPFRKSFNIRHLPTICLMQYTSAVQHTIAHD